jgi:hypothetical protein
MDIFKGAPKPSDSPEQPDTGRRSFMWKVGAGMSAVLAFAVPGMSKPGIDLDTELKARVDQLRNLLLLNYDTVDRTLSVFGSFSDGWTGAFAKRRHINPNAVIATAP